MGRPPSEIPRTTISMRVPVATLDRIEAWGKARELNRSDALRRVMQAGMEKLGLGSDRQQAAKRGPSGLAATRARLREQT